ncbi:MAG TPA: hypothetical protein VFC84_05680 [Desulfosporosinus sp.]|nr:hypothetical protein [Desulfosporosinus sp.]
MNISREFIEKMMEAKKLEKEALMMLFSDKVKVHLDVVGKELKSMLMECLLDSSTGHAETTPEAKRSQGKDKVKKVDIE